MKYILVSGGVISGIGKGVIASSIGTILKHCGLHVTSIKIDPYINIDAGTFSPFEHGEVFVLDDGGEVDLDLGNYERFLDVTLHRDNNITTGKIYQKVIECERKGDYLGKTVQVVPHITDAIQEWVENVAKIPVTEDETEPEVCIIELGGTIGDIEGMPFVEAFRQFQFRVGHDSFCCVHVSLVPQPKSTGESKTKPTQASVKELRGAGITPDLIVCRSEMPIIEEVKNKLSHFCHVKPNQVICIHDCTSTFRVPLILQEQGLIEFFSERLNLNIAVPRPKKFMRKWRDLSDRHDNVRKTIEIALVGKYTRLQDAYASVTKALHHSALFVNRRLTLSYIEAASLEEATKLENPVKYHEAWQILCRSSGVIVPGGFGKRGMEGKIAAVKWCRTTQKPFLGVCLGLQAAVIEFTRNVMGLEGSNTTEIDPETAHPIVIDMPEHNSGQMGGTMRLGKRKTIFHGESILKQMYGNVSSVDERHRHRYEVNPQYVDKIEAAGLSFVGRDDTGTRMEIMELPTAVHPYFVATQYHPEYISRPLKPSPPYLGLVLAAAGKLQTYLNNAASSYSSNTNSEDGEESDDDLVGMFRKNMSMDQLSAAISTPIKPFN
uniref:CTP synthase n=1 Tax=Evadne anonyx TaxID=141404 RepID=A0A9N6ZF97_9CRUS|nr:EOG090X04HX [Evadne anonyx]